jgi:osomolarity two-component system sensor histidine kinase SLN1
MSITASQARGSEEASRHTQPETITVRIEIADTGVGIHRRDMIESKLFSSFSQTEQGRLQGMFDPNR